MNFPKQFTQKNRNKKILKKVNAEISEMRRIENISSFGFELFDLEYNLKNRSSWSEIKPIRFTSDYKSLVFIVINNKQKILPDKTNNCYALIQKIPENYTDFDYAYVSNFIKDFQFCEICGMKAIKNNTCLHCYSNIWDDDLQEDYPQKESYIKSEQLDLYSITSELASVNFKRYDNSGFEKIRIFYLRLQKRKSPTTVTNILLIRRNKSISSFLQEF